MLGQTIFVDLYRGRNEDTQGDQIEWVDENEKIYNSIFQRGCSHNEKNGSFNKRSAIDLCY